jgi:hypothetical protein
MLVAALAGGAAEMEDEMTRNIWKVLKPRAEIAWFCLRRGQGQRPIQMAWRAIRGYPVRLVFATRIPLP